MNLLGRLYGDTVTASAMDEQSYIHSMIAIERAVAVAQGEFGVIPRAAARGLPEALEAVRIDTERLWRETRNVGYPVLPLIQQIDEQLPAELRGYLHLGLTTQDVMDTALVLQINSAAIRQAELIAHLGDALSRRVQESATWPAPARTHAQQAVPTTMGARFAVFLSQVTDLTGDWTDAIDRLSVLSMHGAGGTSAAMGTHAAAVRAHVAEALGLRHSNVPWHVGRQGLARLVSTLATFAAVCSRLAKEVVDLSRNEVGELREATGHLRGASSTMPQKANPIDAEAVIGLAWSTIAQVTPMTRAMEAGHERAAGEWQIEWSAVPAAVIWAASTLAVTARMIEDLVLHPTRALDNLGIDNGAIMAEAYMMQLAPTMGREVAHDVVYRAVRASTASHVPLHDALQRAVQEQGIIVAPIPPQDYVGGAAAACEEATSRWAQARTQLAARSTSTAALTGQPIQPRE